MYIYIYEIFWEPGIVYPVKGFFIIFFIISLSFWDLPKYHLFIIYLSFIYHLFIDCFWGNHCLQVCQGSVRGGLCQGRSAGEMCEGRCARGGLPGESCRGGMGGEGRSARGGLPGQAREAGRGGLPGL